MTGYEMFWPMIAHVVLVFGLYGVLGLRRSAVVKAGKATQDQFRLNRDEPPESLVVRHSIGNQFELPVLFHLCCILLYMTEADNLIAVGLAWAFVATRFLHAYVHITSNNLRYRSPLFAAGYVVLGAMWVWLASWMLAS